MRHTCPSDWFAREGSARSGSRVHHRGARWCLIAALAVTGLSVPANAADATTAPATAAPAVAKPSEVAATAAKATSLADVQQLLDDKKYDAAVQAAAHLLNDPNFADGYKMLLLKAQGHLYLKASEPAATAFAAAARKSGTEAKDAAVASASAELVKRSVHLAYTPKFTAPTGLFDAPAKPEKPAAPAAKAPPAKKGAKNAPPPEVITISVDWTFTPAAKADPIDIVDPTSRVNALKAMYVDQLAAAMPDIKAASAADGLDPLVTALKELGPLSAIELGALGTDTQIAGLLTPLTARADHLMTVALEGMSADQDKIKKRAGETVSAGSRTRYKRGLDTADRNALTSSIATCAQIFQACKGFAAIPGVDATRFSKTGEEAQTVATRATAILRARY